MVIHRTLLSVGCSVMLLASCKTSTFTGTPARSSRGMAASGINSSPTGPNGSQPIYVPVGGSKPLPSSGSSGSSASKGTKGSSGSDGSNGNNGMGGGVGGNGGAPSSGECRTADPNVATCGNGRIDGHRVGETTIRIGGEEARVVVYDPKHPPAGVDGTDSSDGNDGEDGKSGGDDDSDGGDGDAGGDDGSVNGGNDVGGDDGSVNGGSDVGGDDGETSMSATESMTLSQLKEGDDDADCENDTTIIKLDKSGGVLMQQTVHFAEGQAKTVELAGFCNRNVSTRVRMRVMMHGCGSDKALSPADTDYVAKTGGDGSRRIELTYDDGSCMLGTCVDRGSDNTFRLECPHKALHVEGVE
jgi:hypothetical protein